MFNVFLLIDRDASGEIDVGEFFSFFEIEHSPFGDKLFEYMGTAALRACLALICGTDTMHSFLLVGTQIQTAMATWTFMNSVRQQF